MLELNTLIFEQLSEAGLGGLTVGDLLINRLAPWRETMYTALAAMFKSGQVYASRVERTPEGIVPDTDANWTTARVKGYYGYGPQWGVYQITDYALQPLTLTLQATLHAGFQVHVIAVSPNGDDFVVGGKTNLLRLGCLSRCEFQRDIPCVGKVWSLAYPPGNSSQFASGHHNGDIWQWESNGDEIGCIGHAQDRVAALRFSPDRTQLLSAHQLRHDKHYQIRRWTLGSTEPPQGYDYHKTKVKDKIKDNVYALEYLADGRCLVSAGNDKHVRAYSLDRQKVLYRSKAHSGTIVCSARHPIEDLVVVGSWSGKLTLYDFRKLADQEEAGDQEIDKIDKYEKLAIEAHVSRVTSIAFSPSGGLLASGSRDSQIAIWQMPQGILLERWLAHKGWVRGLAFADERTLISGGTDGLIKVWHLSDIGRIPEDISEDDDEEGDKDD